MVFFELKLDSRASWLLLRGRISRLFPLLEDFLVLWCGVSEDQRRGGLAGTGAVVGPDRQRVACSLSWAEEVEAVAHAQVEAQVEGLVAVQQCSAGNCTCGCTAGISGS